MSRMLFASALLAVGGALVSVSAASPRQPVKWQLADGYTATVNSGTPYPGSTWTRRTLVIRKGIRVVSRHGWRNEGLGIQTADVTDDGLKDVLVINYHGGSGGCGRYILFGGDRFRVLWRRWECADNGIVRLLGGALVLWNAVFSSQTEATRGGIHCCWAVWRRTEWRWRDGRLVRARSTLGDPPRLRWRVHLLPGTYPR